MEIDAPRWYDLVVLAWLAVPLPLLAVWGYRRLQRLLAAGQAGVRVRSYRQTIVLEWLSAIGLVVLWLAAGRSLPELGLGWGAGGWRFWLGAGLALAATGVQAWQVVNVRRSETDRATLRQRVRHLEEMLPHTRRELDSFLVLSVTAGICEEVVYRGYAIWLLASLGGLWLAVPGSAVLFSLGHLYQGPRSVAGIVLVGLVTAALYLLTGALWAPILLHAAIDVTSGQMTYEVLRGDRSTAG